MRHARSDATGTRSLSHTRVSRAEEDWTMGKCGNGADPGRIGWKRGRGGRPTCEKAVGSEEGAGQHPGGVRHVRQLRPCAPAPLARSPMVPTATGQRPVPGSSHVKQGMGPLLPFRRALTIIQISQKCKRRTMHCRIWRRISGAEVRSPAKRPVPPVPSKLNFAARSPTHPFKY